MLAAQADRAGGVAIPLGIARDERAELRRTHPGGTSLRRPAAFRRRLGGNARSGPVRAGRARRPQCLSQDQHPSGQAALVWRVERTGGAPAEGPAVSYVFGLPGNPVSSLICFELFVRSCLRRLRGIEPAEPQAVSAGLTADHVARGDRPTYNPARVIWDGSGLSVTPVRWHGSSDLQATVDANAMAVFPGGDRTYSAGEPVDVILWDGWPQGRESRPW